MKLLFTRNKLLYTIICVLCSCTFLSQNLSATIDKKNSETPFRDQSSLKQCFSPFAKIAGKIVRPPLRLTKKTAQKLWKNRGKIFVAAGLATLFFSWYYAETDIPEEAPPSPVDLKRRAQRQRHKELRRQKEQELEVQAQKYLETRNQLTKIIAEGSSPTEVRLFLDQHRGNRRYIVNWLDNQGKAPVAYALDKMNSEMLLVLKTSGADFDRNVDLEGHTALTYVYTHAPRQKMIRIVNENTRRQYHPRTLLSLILQRKQAPAEAKAELFKAIKKGNLHDLKKIVADHYYEQIDLLNQPDKSGKRPLAHAIDLRNEEIIEFLCQNGVDLSLPVDSNEHSPYSYIHEHDDLSSSTIRTLMTNDAGLCRKDRGNHTITTLADKYGDEKLLKNLLDWDKDHCPVCYDANKTALMAARCCGRIFCKPCYEKLDRCPTCRKKLY